ncbi:hypothetical protein B0A48_04556 [Cryoendolithus antarcticus]|uniref:Uncharacterized protein n=1 Tax=Cryoendolithus antarcticus TaxID=1507870 RepID=A0A1V8TFP5_9PEZI|nr:hypothetical protein B0A48_04556 [Cryoendolithus antarcticus]
MTDKSGSHTPKPGAKSGSSAPRRGPKTDAEFCGFDHTNGMRPVQEGYVQGMQDAQRRFQESRKDKKLSETKLQGDVKPNSTGDFKSISRRSTSELLTSRGAESRRLRRSGNSKRSS